MKKFQAILLLIFISSPLWARETISGTTVDKANAAVTIQAAEKGKEKPEPAKKIFRLKNRTVELSLLNMSFNISNDFILGAELFKSPFYMIGNISDIRQKPSLIWKDPLVVSIDEFFNGLQFNFGLMVKPISINFNWKDLWGFGLDIGHIDVVGDVAISGTVMTFQSAANETIKAGAAAFADVGVPVFFNYKNFKIKIRPSVFVPLAYTRPNITYSYTRSVNPETGAEGTRLEVNYDVRVYSLVDMRGLEDGNAALPMDGMIQELRGNIPGIFTSNAGYDFGLGIEYPWDPRLDIGLDMVNIPVPFAAARLNHYMRLEDKVFFDTSIMDLAGLIDGEDIPEDAYGYPEDFTVNYGYDSEGEKIYRPFKMLWYVNYRPFVSPFFTLIPSLGFSVNPLYEEAGAVEGGLSARLDLANIFIAEFGINYNDRKWKNSLDFAVNLRAFELDFGASLQSSGFKKSFQGAGLGINMGIKLGW